MRAFARALAALALILAAATATRAQQPPVFRSGVDVVNVTVAVHDDRGRLVTDLAEQDFKLYQDGRLQQVRVFARAFDPGRDDVLALDLGVLFDTSQSMVQNLRLSRLAATRFLDSVPRARELITIFFDEDIRVSRYDSENQQGLIERIQDITGGRNTCLYDAIAVYLSRIQGSTGRKVLVLFTDGEDSRSELTQAELNRLVRTSPVTIYAIAFAPEGVTSSSRTAKSRQVLEHLADLTGGTVFAPASYKDLPGIYDKILDELKGQYVLGFVPEKPAAAGRYHKLKVEVTRPDVKVRHRPGYAVSESGELVSQ
ncbi:MAG TPA: VWA domain-containing protein [Vicinamibacteria bacterium]|nr:VWA domain-containing protein [Vicinamibacteria bacterium]